MPQRFTSISLYKVTVLTSIVSWLLYHSDAAVRISAPSIFGDGGFLLLHTPIFAGIWLLIYFVELNLGVPRWILALRSSHGVARAVDMMVLVACLVTMIISFGSTTLGYYQTSVILLFTVAALQSLFSGREPSRVFSTTPTLPPAGPPPVPSPGHQAPTIRTSEPTVTPPLFDPVALGSLPLPSVPPTMVFDPADAVQNSGGRPTMPLPPLTDALTGLTAAPELAVTDQSPADSAGTPGAPTQILPSADVPTEAIERGDLILTPPSDAVHNAADSAPVGSPPQPAR